MTKSIRSGGGSGSPQSTLWSPFASGYSSPIGPSREPSPPLTPVTAVETQPVMIPFQSKQALIDDQIRSIQANFHKIKKEKDKLRKDDVLGHKARSYHQQQRPRSGVKAVFVDGSGSRTGSAGTGVYLPRSHGTVVETRKKAGCSTVIIPARVVEALKVHFDKLGVPSTFSSDIPPFHDALLVSMKNKNNKSSSSTRPQSGPPYMAETSAESHQEPPADLPHEWTY
ncbi:G patch domain protein [Hirschfeldia incana]|nr:G patch domain protein [Hirschfeldia incana]